MAECQHEKVYANVHLTSNPPLKPWICRKCGAEGTDRGQFVEYPSEYDRLKETLNGR